VWIFLSELFPRRTSFLNHKLSSYLRLMFYLLSHCMLACASQLLTMLSAYPEMGFFPLEGGKAESSTTLQGTLRPNSATKIFSS